jgi:esterase/lipase superfamily enzyme
VDYREAYVLLVNILRDLFHVEVDPDTRLSRILDPNLPTGELIRAIDDALKEAGHSQLATRLSAEDIRHNTVGGLARRVVELVDQKERERAELSGLEVDDTEGACEFPVWFGTNRQPMRMSGGGVEFSSSRDNVMHYGRCLVVVPKSHKIGSLGSPWWKRLLTGVDDRLRIVSSEELGSFTFWCSLEQELSLVDIDERDAVIFIHGYNVSFSDAALRAAQIGFDLTVRGAMMFFSWPSRGSAASYMADEATIEASEAAITEFLINVAIRSGARVVHIIAHSMGNRGLLRAINRIASKAEEESQVRFGQIILAAPDIDADVFRGLSGAYANVSRRTTLYVCAKDRAVEASGWLHEFPRIGLTPPICVVPGIDTVNVTNVDLTILGHGYVAQARDVLQDMHDLITHGTAPDRRFGLRVSATDLGEQFWIVGG